MTINDSMIINKSEISVAESKDVSIYGDKAAQGVRCLINLKNVMIDCLVCKAMTYRKSLRMKFLQKKQEGQIIVSADLTTDSDV